jgi:hypothetical protein
MPSARTLNANLAAEYRKKHPQPERIAELRERHFEAKVTEWVKRQLAAAPVLSQDARDRLALEVDELITCGAVKGGGARVSP